MVIKQLVEKTILKEKKYIEAFDKYTGEMLLVGITYETTRNTIV